MLKIVLDISFGKSIQNTLPCLCLPSCSKGAHSILSLTLAGLWQLEIFGSTMKKNCYVHLKLMQWHPEFGVYSHVLIREAPFSSFIWELLTRGCGSNWQVYCWKKRNGCTGLMARYTWDKETRVLLFSPISIWVLKSSELKPSVSIISNTHY